MNKLIVFVSIALLSACGTSEEETEAKEEVKSETKKKLEEVQELNVDLEEIDGELDSLINNLN